MARFTALGAAVVAFFAFSFSAVHAAPRDSEWSSRIELALILKKSPASSICCIILCALDTELAR